MKVTVLILRDSFATLQEVAQIPMPAALSLRFALAVSAVRAPMAASDVVFNTLITTCADPVAENPGQFVVREADRERFTKEIDELGRQEIEIAVDQIPIEMFTGFDVKPAMLAKLAWLVKT